AHDRRRLGSFDVDGNGTLYAWGQGGGIAEYAISPNNELRWKRTLVRRGVRLLASFSAEQGDASEIANFYVNDRLGTRLSIRADSLSTNVSTTTIESLPFGRDFPGTSSTTERFANYSRSTATGLDYATNRSYDPMQGRFLQVDPLGLLSSDLKNPQSLNLYAYVRNDPTNRSHAYELVDDHVP